MGRALLLVALLCSSMWPTVALARRAALSAGDAALPSQGAAMGRAAIAQELVAAPEYTFSTRDLRTDLEGTRGELMRCLSEAGLAGSLRVAVRVSSSRVITVDATAPRHDAAVEGCAELVVRRAVTGDVMRRPIGRPVRASISVRYRVPRAPHAPVAPPAPPPATGDLSAFESQVHAAMDRDRGAMLSCLSSAAPGVVGNATLRVTLAPDGSLSLTSANLPPGIPAGPGLPCLSARVAQLRFSPGPPRALAVEHTFPLGL